MIRDAAALAIVSLALLFVIVLLCLWWSWPPPPPLPPYNLDIYEADDGRYRPVRLLSRSYCQGCDLAQQE